MCFLLLLREERGSGFSVTLLAMLVDLVLHLAVVIVVVAISEVNLLSLFSPLFPFLSSCCCFR